MNFYSVFSKKLIFLFIFISIILCFVFTNIQYKSQVALIKYKFTSKINNEIKKSLNKKIFEIEGTITSLSNFYQASDDFSSSNFSNISTNLIKYYPSIEKILYAQLINKDELKEFYKEIDNMNMVNYKIYPKSKFTTFLPIVNISPNSFNYTKYLGYDLYDNIELKKILLKSSLSSVAKCYTNEIVNENINTINMVKATYYGTMTPVTKEELVQQTSGYFIISINLDTILNHIKSEFPSYNFSLKNDLTATTNNDILKVFKSKLEFPNNIDVWIYSSKQIYLDDININKILIRDFILLLIFLLIFIISFKYKESLLIKDNHLKQLEKSERLASMGEMIGNIAHQWRQPLSVISTASTGLQLNLELNTLNNEKINNSCELINTNAQYLSKTIDDFKNFIKGDRIKGLFFPKDTINSFVHIVEGTIKNYNINLIINIEDNLKINGYENELIQCLINIFNNSKDALIENKIKDKYIFIKINKINKKVIIKIKDNAGGIPTNIITKIFEPYFTTKHKSQGTGLGLHMTYSLIVNGMNGLIEVKNVNFIHNHKNYKGAEFSIYL